MLTGRKSGSISRIVPPGRALATRLATAVPASPTWCSTARAVTRSKPPARPARPGCRPGGTPARARPGRPGTGPGPPPPRARPAPSAGPATRRWTRYRSRLRGCDLPGRCPAAPGSGGAWDRAAATSGPAGGPHRAGDDRERTLACPPAPRRPVSPAGLSCWNHHLTQAAPGRAPARAGQRPPLPGRAGRQRGPGEDVDGSGVHWCAAVRAAQLGGGDLAAGVVPVEHRGPGRAGQPAVAEPDHDHEQVAQVRALAGQHVLIAGRPGGVLV